MFCVEWFYVGFFGKSERETCVEWLYIGFLENAREESQRRRGSISGFWEKSERKANVE